MEPLYCLLLLTATDSYTSCGDSSNFLMEILTLGGLKGQMAMLCIPMDLQGSDRSESGTGLQPHEPLHKPFQQQLLSKTGGRTVVCMIACRNRSQSMA